MKYLFFVFVFALATNPVSAAEECKVGQTVTLTWKLDGEPMVNGERWMETGVNATPCTVTFVVGEGKLPAGCTAGKTMEASGTVASPMLLALLVKSARCY
jgi:hypothetical protein